MTEDPSEENNSKSVTDAGSLTEISVEPLSAQPIARFSTDDVQQRLEDDDYVSALLLTSTLLESILSMAIQQEYGISSDQFDGLYGRKSLGRYHHMCAVLDLFDEHQKAIKEVSTYRNKLVHEFGYLDSLKEDEDVKNEVGTTLEDAIVFIGQVEL